jgi:hypothetical protein
MRLLVICELNIKMHGTKVEIKKIRKKFTLKEFKRMPSQFCQQLVIP